MRTRRTQRIDLDEADRLAAGDTPGPHQAGLGALLDALRAPATPGELSAEKATVAAFRANRKRAARAARRTRSVLVPALTALALLMFGGTALAARTGTLPAGAQQHAHRLFSALGVPAPRTGPGAHPTPVASAGPSPSRPPAPPAVELGWCADWQPGGPELSTDDHRRLRAAAGSEARIPGYCDQLRRSAGNPSASAPPPPPTRPASPSGTPSPSVSTPSPRTTPSHPAPAHPTPSHHQPTPGGHGPTNRPDHPTP